MNAIPGLSDEAAIARIETTIDIELRGLQEMRAGLSNGLAQAFLASAAAIEAAGGAVVVTGMANPGISATRSPPHSPVPARIVISSTPPRPAMAISA